MRPSRIHVPWTVFATAIIFVDIWIFGDKAVLASADVSYQDDPEFLRHVEHAKKESTKKSNNVHDHILAINEVHQRFAKSWSNREDTDVMDEIIKDNENDGKLYFEGDIILDENDKMLVTHQLNDTSEMNDNDTHLKKRNAQLDRHKLWKNRVIPFAITPAVERDRAAIMKSIAKFHAKTCLRFKEVSYRAKNMNFILFVKKVGCHSRIGKPYWKKEPQELSLGVNCGAVSIIVHELLHSLGFFHEQSRPDRDMNIRIFHQNIVKGMESNFEKYEHGETDMLGMEYDFKSIMHYGRTSFTKNGQDTMQRIDDPKAPLGNTDFSTIDLIEINALYNCQKHGAGYNGFSDWSSWSRCVKFYWNDPKCYRRRQRFCFTPVDIPAAVKRFCPNANKYGIDEEKNECPCHTVDGDWSRWAAWSQCSVTCEKGVQSRTRMCNNPTPRNGGRECEGKNTDKRSCVKRSCSFGPFDADFDTTNGVWRNTQSGDRTDWKINRGKTRFARSGPSVDHTTGTNEGAYAYTDSSVARPGWKAEFESSWMPANSPMCLQFWYFMHSQAPVAMGELAVTISVKERSPWYIFHKKGDQGDGWKFGEAKIDLPGERYKLSFRATFGNPTNGLSDIAIDDVAFKKGLCGSKPNPPAECVDKNRKCSMWAKKNECNKNPTWMSKNCCQACKFVPCKDSHKKCNRWAKLGECYKNPKWMRTSCCKSCQANPGKLLKYWRLSTNKGGGIRLKGNAAFRTMDGKKALCLNGQRGTYATTPAIAIQRTSFTIGAWVRVPSPPNQISHIYSDWSAPFAFRLWIYGGQLIFQMIDAAGDSRRVLGGNVPTDKWFNAVATWDRSPRTASIYLDGNLKQKKKFQPKSLDLMQTNHARYNIGLKKDSGHVMKGCVRDLAVFARALSPGEVKEFFTL